MARPSVVRTRAVHGPLLKHGTTVFWPQARQRPANLPRIYNVEHLTLIPIPRYSSSRIAYAPHSKPLASHRCTSTNLPPAPHTSSPRDDTSVLAPRAMLPSRRGLSASPPSPLPSSPSGMGAAAAPSLHADLELPPSRPHMAVSSSLPPPSRHGGLKLPA